MDYVRGAVAASVPLSAAPALISDEELLDPGGTGEWYDPGFVRGGMESAGFERVEVEEVERVSRWENAREFVDFWGGNMVRIVTKHWSEEAKAEYAALLMPALIEYLEGKFGKDKPVDMPAGALIAVGRKPEH